ncbi:MAG: sensor histidine kinase [Acidimicrobiia bacterium]
MDGSASPSGLPRRVSRVWTATAALSLLGAVALPSAAAAYQVRVTRPQGEGELFRREAALAGSMLIRAEEEGTALDQAVRHIRNDLRVEAVAVVDPAGNYLASSSPSLVGSSLEPPFLAGLLQRGDFGAVAASLERPIFIDGVEEWEEGDSLYLVLQPLDPGGALVISYDVSELLNRRAAQQGIRPLTIQLAGAGVFLLLAGILLLVARAGARRRIAEAEREAQLIEARSRELERHNRALDEAREAAEEALALAEETNRIRSEFVLMINHELRTPLTAVVTGAEVLLDDEGLPQEDRHQVLADMVRDGRRLQELISQMLTVARIENRGLGYRLRKVPIWDVLERLQGMRVKAFWDGEGPLPEPAEADGILLRSDPDSLAQLILSLTDNAFTHGATQVSVRVVTELPFAPLLEVGLRPAAALYFLVEDDGPGIDPRFLPRAFEKFEKHGRSSGTGLGLYLARMMAEAIEGAIAVTTGPKGTSMAVAVPLAVTGAQDAVA